MSETKPGYSEWVPNFYQATLLRLVVKPTDAGVQTYQATFDIIRNEVSRDLADFVGQPVMLGLKSRQIPLPIEVPLAVLHQGQEANRTGFEE